RLRGERAGRQRAWALAAGQTVERQCRERERLRGGHGLAGGGGVAGVLEEAPWTVRVAAHEHELLDGEWKRSWHLLRHHGHLPRQLPRRQRVDRAPVQANGAPLRRQHARDKRSSDVLPALLGPMTPKISARPILNENPGKA